MGSVKAEIIKLGCLRFNGKPVSPGVRYNMETISFGDTDPEKAISFVKWKNLLVADRCIFTSISWNDLNHSGLIFGRPVKIDGDPYICRSLRVGKEEGSSNEWDAILDDLEESDDLWHWDYIYFWARKMKKIWHRIVRFAAGCRPATGTTTVPRLGSWTSVFAPSWNLCPLRL